MECKIRKKCPEIKYIYVWVGLGHDFLNTHVTITIVRALSEPVGEKREAAEKGKERALTPIVGPL